MVGGKGVDLTGLLGEGIKEDWGSRGGAPVGDLRDKVPQMLNLFLWNYT